MSSHSNDELIRRLNPLLGSLANLVSRGQGIGPSTLQTLLLAVDLDADVHAMQMVERWASLFQALRDQPTPDLRRATREALTLAGLPDEEVESALGVVAGAVAQTAASKSQSGSLRVSTSQLQFGTLEPGKPAFLNFEVTGGPGKIVVESKRVIVSPREFGSATTRIEVGVKPLKAGSFGTRLQVVNDAETIEVRVVAEWLDSFSVPQPAVVPTSQGVTTANVENEMILSLGVGINLVFIRIPAGEFLMGSKKADRMAMEKEKPQHVVKLPEFYIGKLPVTLQQYQEFVKWGGYLHSPDNATPGHLDHPVIIDRYQDALAFCRWASEVTGYKLRLPTEAEWEKAARGTDGRIWPWGNEPPTPNHCTCSNGLFRQQEDTTAVGKHSPLGDSPYGCADMAGNVEEWTCSLDYGYPYQYDDGREDPAIEGTHVLRGGSRVFGKAQVRCAYRGTFAQGFSTKGFRICLSDLSMADTTAGVLPDTAAVQGHPEPALGTPTDQVSILQTDVEQLSFGSLKPGQAATQEFEVSGGPGQIVSESDQVFVAPRAFGAEATRIRVEIKASMTGVLWTTVRCITAHQTKEIPVYVEWTEQVFPSEPIAIAGAELALPTQPYTIQSAILAPTEDILALSLAPDIPLVVVRVPTGKFIMGSSGNRWAYENERPQHSLKLQEYYIGKYSVTVRQFQAFVQATRYAASSNDLWSSQLDHPVIINKYEDALAFCRWASEVTGYELRLPTEAEWEKAARGTDGRIWPWGNEPPTAELCNFMSGWWKSTETTPVGKYSPRGDSPYGCADMAGNVADWTSTIATPYPYRSDDGREDPRLKGSYVLRGGSYNSNARDVRCAYRDASIQSLSKKGFRVCLITST